MTNLKHVKIFADGADLDGMLALYANPSIKGFTTNPTLMRKAGIADYEAFARERARGDPRPPDLLRGLRRRVRRDGARRRARSPPGATNVYVKIPVTNTKGEFAGAAGRSGSRKRASSSTSPRS